MVKLKIAAVTLAAAFVVSGLTAPAALAGGKSSDAVGADPAPGSHVSPLGFFLLDLRPGESATQSLRVHNTNPRPVDVRVQPVDAVTGKMTGAEFRAPGSANTTTSQWLSVTTPEFTMAPGEYREIPFNVNVPPGTKPGQYLAGLSSWVPLVAPATAADPGAKKAGFAINLQYQRVVAVEVDVPGPRAPKLVVTGAEPQVAPTGITLGVHIANQGSAFAHGTGVIRIPDTKTDFSFKIDTFVAGTSIVYPMQWTQTVVPGTHHVEVDLEYEDGRRASWNGVVTIGDALASQLGSSLANIKPPTKKAGFNWLIVLVAVLFVALVAGAIALRRSARRPTHVKYQAT
jgi:hypothetical protein